MGMFYERKDGETGFHPIAIIVWIVVFIFATIGIISWIVPQYNVWSKTLSGKAELQKQEYERQVKVVQSKADLEAANNYADAEVRRAEGAAGAAKIISGALEKNPSYLQYLAIEAQKENAQGQNHTTIYIPVGDNGIPLVNNVNQ